MLSIDFQHINNLIVHDVKPSFPDGHRVLELVLATAPIVTNDLNLYRKVCVCLCVYPSTHIHVAVCGPIGTGGNLLNGWTDWHQIWHTYADSSGNEHRLKNNYTLETPGILRGLCGQKLKPGKCGKRASLIAG